MGTRKDKQALQRYLEKLQLIREHGHISASESKRERYERIERAKKDYAFFVETYFPHYATSKCADFHIKAANAVRKDKRYTGVFEWARGLAKSTHFTVFIPLWLWIQKDLHVMVCISSNSDTAKTLLSDLQAEFEANPQLKHDFGSQVTSGDWAEGEFKTKDGCAFFSRGRGQKLRGLRYRRHRVDYKVMDDLDDDELIRNPRRVKQVVNWVLTAVMGTGDIGTDRTIIVNNRISDNSILSFFAAHKAWKHSKVNALDSKGNPSWPEKYTKEYYERVEQLLTYIAFQTEYMNNPTIEGDIFKVEQIQYKIMRNWKKYDSIVGYWDESYTDNQTSDFNAVVVVGYRDKHLHILHCFIRQTQMKNALHFMYDVDEEARKKNVIINWYRESLPIEEPVENAMAEVAKERGYELPIIKNEQTKTNKFQRMINMAYYYQRGTIWYNLLHKNSYDMQTLVAQTLAIEPGYKSHDDGPDAQNGAINKLMPMVRTSGSLPMVGERKDTALW